MNHKASESRTRIIPSTHSYTHSHQQQHSPLHSSSSHANHDDQPRNPPKDETDAEKADRLLAATLLFYKEASTTSLTNFSPSLSPLFLELQTFTQHHSLARQFVVPGDTLLEQRSARATLLAAPWGAEPTITTIINFLFWMIVNLRKPLVSFKHSIEVNARAVFNVVIASVIDGAEVEGCERLLSLCIHLKDTDSCYPLRTLATSICMEMTSEESLPLYARTSMLKFILGPAEFVLHHLETRIQLSEKIDILLLKNSYDDVEFRSLVQRVAKKIGSRQPTSTLEQLKFRMYQYLEGAVSDPLRYSRPELITKFMPPTRWATLLDRDFIFSCYLDECSSQMLLFLDTIRTMGISPSLLALDSVPSDTLSEGILNVLTARQDIQSVVTSLTRNFPKELVSSDVDSVEYGFKQVFLTTMNSRDVLAELQLHLTSAGVELVHSLKIANGDQIDASKVEKLHESVKQLLLSIPVAPSHFLPRLLWTAALSLEACRDLEEAFGPASPVYGKVQDIKATCLDIFLASVVYRNEPRFPPNATSAAAATTTTTATFEHLNEDLELCLTLFCVLFPAHKESTWTFIHQDQTTENWAFAQPSLYSAFLTRLLENLLPLLERIDHRTPDSTSSSALILAGVTFHLLALLLPSSVLLRDRIQIAKALEDISDLQRDSSLLSSSTAWQSIFGPTSYVNPLNILEARLDALQ
ncbi:hypothetical protein F5H01DRAFT_350337 [Linnemannia elongata]|nr:hypothetical protein F5H01DRAFT_350337 [Linnemannia elongata]